MLSFETEQSGPQVENLHIHRLLTPPEDLRMEIMEGLQKPQKQLSPKLFYDERGSRLFDAITELPEYYPTRTEKRIFERHQDEMRSVLGSRGVLIEPGSGSCQKVRPLLHHPDTHAYVPIEISANHLISSALEVAMEFPRIQVHAVCGDFTQTDCLPDTIPEGMRTAFFPGSTIGNFEPKDALRLLQSLRSWVDSDGAMLIGVDTKKEESVLHAAYNDRQGITAEFNRNMLNNVNQLTGADFRPEQFEHEAFYNPRLGRIEMHLRSLCKQRVQIGEAEFEFQEGETIHTENSYKYETQEFADLAARAGFHHQHCWQDPQGHFAVHYLSA